ncbi:hypothetical protein BU14_2243s0001 [Porphyra umbilicalis]|uniref:Uncharacterized protein n=1 Tax=Porphyra umbilicalis TaxID=2786 RepID=A0A1X6NJK7_PORUM|nr:hypothetical protein BU14_2243s0001 [Porphyra umbilicalis]|eukprot:OSX68788.1 hypothetical protein BU14_2243s0001 [Porphyra umbilicalis]
MRAPTSTATGCQWRTGRRAASMNQSTACHRPRRSLAATGRQRRRRPMRWRLPRPPSLAAQTWCQGRGRCGCAAAPRRPSATCRRRATPRARQASRCAPAGRCPTARYGGRGRCGRVSACRRHCAADGLRPPPLWGRRRRRHCRRPLATTRSPKGAAVARVAAGGWPRRPSPWLQTGAAARPPPPVAARPLPPRSLPLSRAQTTHRATRSTWRGRRLLTVCATPSPPTSAGCVTTGF